MRAGWHEWALPALVVAVYAVWSVKRIIAGRW